MSLKSNKKVAILYSSSLCLSRCSYQGNNRCTEKSQSFIHQVYVSHGYCVVLNAWEAKKSQSFIHQVYVSHVVLFLLQLDSHQKSQSFIHQVYVSHRILCSNVFLIGSEGRNPLFIKSMSLTNGRLLLQMTQVLCRNPLFIKSMSLTYFIPETFTAQVFSRNPLFIKSMSLTEIDRIVGNYLP